MSVRNTSEEGVVRRENLAGGGGGLEEITGKEDWIGKYLPRYQTREHFILSVSFHHHRVPTVRGILQKLSESRHWLDFVNNLKDENANFKELVPERVRNWILQICSEEEGPVSIYFQKSP